MQRTVCSLLVGSGGLVAVLGWLTQKFAPDVARPTLLAGVIGGGLIALSGLLGFLGKPKRGWAIFTMALTCFVLLSQAVTHWIPPAEPRAGARALALLATLMLVATFGTLMAVLYAGAPGPATSDGGSGGSGPDQGRNPPGLDAAEAWKEARHHRGSAAKR